MVKCIKEQINVDTPLGWEWTKISNIAFVTKLAGFEYTKNIAPNLCNSGIPLFNGKNIQDSQVVYNFESFIPETVSDELSRSQITRKCILTPYVGTIGNIGIHNKTGKYHLGSNVGKIELFNESVELLEEYVVAYLKSIFGYKQLTKHLKATAQASISIEAIRDVYIPIPPISEQKRIVETINKYFGIIQTLETDTTDIKETIAAAKSKILDLAIRGKLVPQDPNDEPASVLLERIQAEKEELIRKDKIKRDKGDSVIFRGDDNSYHKNIPQNWCISTLSELTTSLSLNDGDWILSENMNENGEIKLIQLGSVGRMKYIDKGFKYINEETFEKLGCMQIYSGYILINRIISDNMNICVLPQIDGKLITTVDTCWIKPKTKFYNVKYLMYALSAPTIQSNILLQSFGTTRKRISKNNLIKIPFPLPPLSEQHRIVEKIELHFTYLDTISESLS